MTADQKTGPYAPKKAVMQVIQRYRDRGLPEPLTSAALGQIGVPLSMAPRTLQALRFLNLVDDDGNRLEAFERLKRATTDEYPNAFGEIVKAAYLPVFTIVNPAEDGDVAISDAFRQYEPGAQRDKMVALFRGLCEEAGIIAKSGKRTRAARSPRPRVETPAPRRRRSQVMRETDDDTEDDVENPPPPLDYQVVSAIFQRLPRNARWTEAQRERWIHAMTAAVDLVVEVAPDDELHGR